MFRPAVLAAVVLTTGPVVTYYCNVSNSNRIIQL